MSYPGLPSTISVDGVAYRIVEDPSILPAEDRRSQEYREDGEYDAEAQTIKIKPGMALDYARHIAVHEALHALWEHAGMTAAGGPLELIEEQVVTALARRLVGFLRDNPEFVRFVAGRNDGHISQSVGA